MTIFLSHQVSANSRNPIVDNRQGLAAKTCITSGPRKVLRYFGTSLIAVALSQGALTVAYGCYHASVPVAVAVALAVSVFPSYWLNLTFVWPTADRRGRCRQLAAFLALAVAGSGLTAWIADATQSLAKRSTTDHQILTFVVAASAAFTTLLVWLTRYLVLDHVVFRTPSTAGSAG